MSEMAKMCNLGFSKIICFSLLLNAGVPLYFPASQTKITVKPAGTPFEGEYQIFKPPSGSRRAKVGLVLSGGGSRGLAQIGVLRVLEEHNIPVDLIVGNSFGSVVGGLYAAGYSTAEIESLALNTDWTELLSFTEETKRTDLFIGQKHSQQEGFFSIRFEGLEPIIPSSISGGQRLSNFFSYLTLQAPYHPRPGFDGLKIPFRAIATDILSGKRVVIDKGSLAEAMRASVTVPLLYSPLERDSMYMVDGGLTSNIPVDVAKSLGCDIVIAVNTTSSMRSLNQLKAPWEIADQIMTIMMQESNEQQLRLADVVLTPLTGDRIVSDFSGIDSLIRAGEDVAERNMEKIGEIIYQHSKNYYDSVREARKKYSGYDNLNRFLAVQGADSTEGLRINKCAFGREDSFSVGQFRYYLDDLYESGRFRDIYAEVEQADSVYVVTLFFRFNPPVREIAFTGNHSIPDSLIRRQFDECRTLPAGSTAYRKAFENTLKLYRARGYSLARIDSVLIDASGKNIRFQINEGKISKIDYEGNERTKSYIIRREFPMGVGDVFNIDAALQGIVNMRSTGLFEYVLLDVAYKNNEPVVVLKVNEKSSELMRLGFHADNENGIVGNVGIRDANFRGAWEDLGVFLRYGYRNRFVQTEYTVNRIFHSYFTFNLRGYYKSRDVYTYQYDPAQTVSRWERIESGKYREIKYGGTATFGSHFARFGDLTAEMRIEGHRIESVDGYNFPENYRFVSLKFQSIVDTEDKFYFPTSGMIFALMFESASKRLGSDIGFGKIGFIYENYFTFIREHTVRTKLSFGYADKTLPLAEQFSLGGQNSFLGLREDDSRGRQLFLLNFDYRLRFPFKLIFDTFFKLRGDIGTISLEPQELKIANFRYGFGAEIALDTPIGPASVAAGKSFFFRKGLTDLPLAAGPLLFYFSVGPNL